MQTEDHDGDPIEGIANALLIYGLLFSIGFILFRLHSVASFL